MLIAAILLLQTSAWGPQDKATKLPRLWLPTATPVIAGETSWPLDAAQRRKLGKVLPDGATSCVFDVVWGSGSRRSRTIVSLRKSRRGKPRRLRLWSSSSRR